MTKKMLKVFEHQTITPPPIWMMRQAGRYLPEYREVRKKAGSFLDLCYNPKLACEVTMQPILRFGFDAAILFSDILVIPHALGRDLHFEEGRGPILQSLSLKDIDHLKTDKALENLEPSFETLRLLKKSLPSETALIGFCGAPWTVATYMIAGHSTKDHAPARLFAMQHPKAMQDLLIILADISANYLIHQIKAGAEIVQIFDSWAGILDEVQYNQYCVIPVNYMVRKIRAKYPNVPIIGFPKGAGALYENYAEKTGVSAVALDWTVPASLAKKIQKNTAIQGNLDPLRLVAGGEALQVGINTILQSFADGRLIFNLGHGITPNTPIEHVEAMIKQVRNFHHD